MPALATSGLDPEILIGGAWVMSRTGGVSPPSLASVAMLRDQGSYGRADGMHAASSSTSEATVCAEKRNGSDG